MAGVGGVLHSDGFWWGRVVEEHAEDLGFKEEVQVGVLTVF